MKTIFFFLLIAFSLGARANEITIYLNSTYAKKYPYAKDSIKTLIEDYVAQSTGNSYSVDINWLNYSDALDFAQEDGPSIALLTTGMYCHINQINPESAEQIRMVGIVSKFGTTFYKYMILLKKGYELEPSSIKGKLAIKKKRSLSGSLFSLNYLVEKHGFPRELLFDEHVRSEWAMYDKYHAKLDTLKASTTDAILYCGEGLDVDRAKIAQNGWEVFPKPDEEAASFKISRSLLMTKNLSPDLSDLVKDLFNHRTDVGAKILRLINVERIEDVNHKQIETVIEEYNRIVSPKTEFEIFVSRCKDQQGLYLSSFILLIISHLVFRYRIAEVKDSFFWIAMILVIKLAVFVCGVWYFNPEFAYFISYALFVGTLDKEAIKKIIQKMSPTSNAL